MPPSEPQCLDAFEPNDTDATAHSLEPIRLDKRVAQSGTLHAEADVDHFRLRAVEDTGLACTPFSKQAFQLQIKLNAPPDVDSLRLTSGTTEVFAKGGESATLLLQLNGKCAPTPDIFDVAFRIEAGGDPKFSCTPYTFEYVFQRAP